MISVLGGEEFLVLEVLFEQNAAHHDGGELRVPVVHHKLLRSEVKYGKLTAKIISHIQKTIILFVIFLKVMARQVAIPRRQAMTSTMFPLVDCCQNLDARIKNQHRQSIFWQILVVEVLLVPLEFC